MPARSTRIATSKVRALAEGYLRGDPVKEGQTVKKGDLMFKIIPILYQAKLDAELAEATSCSWKFELHQEDGRGKSGLSE